MNFCEISSANSKKSKLNDEVCENSDHILDWINVDECDVNSDVIFNQEMSSEKGDMILDGINQPKRVKFTNSVFFVSHPHFSM